MLLTPDGKIRISGMTESREKVEESRELKSLDLDKLLNADENVKINMVEYKTTEAQRRAMAKYAKNFKRINCRLTPEMYQQIVDTGKSANTVIVEALTAYFEKRYESTN